MAFKYRQKKTLRRKRRFLKRKGAKTYRRSPTKRRSMRGGADNTAWCVVAFTGDNHIVTKFTFDAFDVDNRQLDKNVTGTIHASYGLNPALISKQLTFHRGGAKDKTEYFSEDSRIQFNKLFVIRDGNEWKVELYCDGSNKIDGVFYKNHNDSSSDKIVGHLQGADSSGDTSLSLICDVVDLKFLPNPSPMLYTSTSEWCWVKFFMKKGFTSGYNPIPPPPAIATGPDPIPPPPAIATGPDTSARTAWTKGADTSHKIADSQTNQSGSLSRVDNV